MQSPPDLSSGAIFGRQYRVLSRLAEGGMGVVYLVEQVSTHKQRALKVMQPALVRDPKHRERFLQEAWVASQIESDHVVEVVDAGVDESGVPFIAMELLRGQTLAERVDTAGALPLEIAREVFRQVRHPLEQAHRLGLVHRDLKPENVYLAQARRTDVPFTTKLLDFGISKWIQEARTAAANSQVIGSPFWMAPEQLEHGSRIAPATDVWALGLIAFYALTSKVYWRTANTDGSSISSFIYELVADPIIAASQRASALGVARPLPEGFDGWFARAVSRKSDERFANAGDALEALDQVFLGAGVVSSPDRTGGFRVLSAPASVTAPPSQDPTPPTPPPEMTSPLPLSKPVSAAVPVEPDAGARLASMPPPPVAAAAPAPIAQPAQKPPSPPTSGPELSLSETSYTFARESQVDRVMGTSTRRTLFEAAVARNDLETARIAAQAIVLREGPETARSANDYLLSAAPPAPVVPRGHVSEGAWNDPLLPTPSMFAPMAKLFHRVTPVVYQALAKSPRDSGLIDRERVDPMSSSAAVLRGINPLHQAMLLAGTAFDITTMPTLYYRASLALPLQCVASDPWSTLVGPWALTQPPPSATIRAFVAARHIALYRPEHYVRVLCPTDDELVRFVDGLRAIAAGSAAPSNAALAAVHARFGAGQKAHDEFVALVTQCSSIDPRGYARASDCAAVRAGMLLCADLFAVRDALAVHPGVAVVQGATELLEDVSSFAVTDSFTRLRKELVGRG
ncbi:MAG: serine/threonine protein kinase [Myxococcales bacterium]|nr:serine/threonine protein kinase [Myxococcales bacterium]